MNQSLSLQTKPRITTTGLVLSGCLLLYLILQVGLTWLAPRMDQTWSQLLVAAVMLTVALLLEKLFWGRQPLAALRMLGFGKANWRAMVVAVIISALMLLFFPIFFGADWHINHTQAGLVVDCDRRRCTEWHRRGGAVSRLCLWPFAA